MKFTVNYNQLFTIAHGTWAIPIITLIRIISPLLLIRVGVIRSDRIGHFVADSAHQFVELSMSTSGRTIDLYWIDKYTCNEQWKKMVMRNMPIYWWVKYIDVWNYYLPGGSIHSRPSSSTNSRDINGLLEKSNVKMMDFLPDEEKEAIEWLKKYGWKEGQPFVCLLARDSAYLEDEFGHIGRDWTYHSYRNSDIDTYIDAMEWLANQGVLVLRMGKKMSKPIYTNHAKIIDYSFCTDKSDFLDIWLFANCDLCISTSCGPDWISDTYRRPILYLNYLPLTDMISWSNSINCPKKLKWSNSGKLLNIEEYLRHGYYTTEEYKNSRIEIINLTSEEILSAVKECWGINYGSLVYGDTDALNQDKFIKILTSNINSCKGHGFVHKDAKISLTFLHNNPLFLQ
jgi:putative glycosyltransferase (TIGR04372 family)